MKLSYFIGVAVIFFVSCGWLEKKKSHAPDHNDDESVMKCIGKECEDFNLEFDFKDQEGLSGSQKLLIRLLSKKISVLDSMIEKSIFEEHLRGYKARNKDAAVDVDRSREILHASLKGQENKDAHELKVTIDTFLKDKHKAATKYNFKANTIFDN